jgi:seryl-tRNA synthetase
MFEVLHRFPGLYWTDNGQSVLSGPVLQLARRLDAVFLELAASWAADEYRFPTFISARELQERLNYLGSFPQQVTFPVKLAADEANLAHFTAGPLDEDHAVKLTDVCPVRDILTPAACAHAYLYLQNREFTAPYYLTCSSTCYRNESHYQPLERQWAFTMREVICLGTADEVQHFLRRTQDMTLELAAKLELPIEWVRVTDSFFKASDDEAVAEIDQTPVVKNEAVYGPDSLAIGSANFHHDLFGNAFGIRRSGTPAYSGCVGFGLERWLYAVATQHGPDPREWPVLV